MEEMSTTDVVEMTGAAPDDLRDHLFVELRRAIVEGAIPAGSKISEPDLARRFGVSRAPLREALGRLEACNLVVRRPNFGARVIALSVADLIELYDMREVMEGLAARRAAEAMTEDEIAGLRALLDEHERAEALRTGSAYRQQEGADDFHWRLAQGSHNARLVKFLCEDIYHLMRMYRYQRGMVSPRVVNAFHDHRHIVDAIAHRDAEMAELLMRRHIRAARAAIAGNAAASPRPGTP